MKLLLAIPAYNEARILRNTLVILENFFRSNLPELDWNIVVADNGSTDNTPTIVFHVQKNNPRILYLHVRKKGKGCAIRTAWKTYTADLYAFMDADLSTDLSAFPLLIDAIQQEGFDVAIGSRNMVNSVSTRSFYRKKISFVNNALMGWLLRTKISDTPCGFKVFNKKSIDEVLPHVENNTWFFDSEMVLRAERLGYKIKEVPVVWSDAGDSLRKTNVDVLGVASEYYKNIWRLRKTFQKHEKKRVEHEFIEF